MRLFRHTDVKSIRDHAGKYTAISDLQRRPQVNDMYGNTLEKCEDL